MNDLDVDFDTQMTNLESEWQKIYAENIEARATYGLLSAHRPGNSKVIDEAWRALEKTEANKERVLAKIERLEHRMLTDQ